MLKDEKWKEIFVLKISFPKIQIDNRIIAKIILFVNPFYKKKYNYKRIKLWQDQQNLKK